MKKYGVVYHCLIHPEKLPFKLPGADVFHRPEGVAEMRQAVESRFVSGIRNAFGRIAQNRFGPSDAFGQDELRGRNAQFAFE